MKNISRHSTYQQVFGISRASTFIFYNTHNYHLSTFCNVVTAGGNVYVLVL